MKSTAPGSLLYYICLCDLFSFAFVFRSIFPKTQKYLAAIYSYLFYLAFREIYLSNLSYFYPVYLPISGTIARKGLTTPLTRWVASLCYLCVGAVHVVLHGPKVFWLLRRDSTSSSLPLDHGLRLHIGFDHSIFIPTISKNGNLDDTIVLPLPLH